MKEYPNSYNDRYRYQSIHSHSKWLCRYSVLYENALKYLTGTFRLHGIDKAYIEELSITIIPTRKTLERIRWSCTRKEKRAGCIEVRSWEENKKWNVGGLPQIGRVADSLISQS